ncbi:PAS domain S-box protein [Muricoccus aerilatus]|uniref:PAS domain S-box protein n=1 Tax=Muricoccus aerilatus TaxID=452982 RepID=UPI000693DA8F|nr:PAS domain S-box protein [Roseomonas aerilata]
MAVEGSPSARVPAFLAGGGEMGARMRAHDWGMSLLGPPERWAQPLKTLVAVMLASNQPMFVAWGPQRLMLYNDSYSEILGLKHPAALGQPFEQVWSEIWDELEPIMARCYDGEPTQMDDITLLMHRHGYLEETHFAFSYTPVRDEAGGVTGVFCACAETTAKVLAERRQAFRLGLEDKLGGLSDPRQAMAAAAKALGCHLDAAQVGYAEVDRDGHATTGGEFHDGRLPGFLPGRYRLKDYGTAMAADMAAGRIVVVHDVWEDARTSSSDILTAYTAISLRAFVIIPLVKEGRLTAYLYAAHSEPRRWSDEDVLLAREVAERTWAAVEQARAEAALRESEGRFRFLDRLGQVTAHATAPREIMAATAGLLGEYLRTTRCAYADVDADNDRFTIRDDWTDGAASSAGEYSLDLFGSRAAAEMRTGRTLIVRDVDKELATGDGGAMFNAIGIKAIVCCPLVKRERLVAMMAVHQSSPRDWTAGEVALLETVVERAWAHIERVRAEEALRESEARFRLTADAVPQIIWITDAEGRTEFFNRQWSDYTGVPYEPATAAEVAASFVHPDDAALTMERFEEARRTGGTFLVEHRIRSKAGDWRWFLVRGEPHRDPRSSRITRWFGASVDIHDRRHAETALRESEARWRGLFERMQEGFALCELIYGAEGRAVDYRHLELNAAWERLTGVPNEAVQGRLASEAIPGLEPFWLETYARVVETGEPAHFEHYLAAYGRWFEVTAYRTEPGRFAAVFSNVTGRRRAEERQALLAREVDHRAKNTLAVVQAALRLTKAPDLSGYIRAIEGRVGALARAQTLLADDRWAGADLRTLLRGELAPFLGASNGGGPLAELDGPAVALPAGAAQPLAMAVHELATNALKYGALSVPTGRVAVSWRLESEPLGTLRLRWAERGGPPVTAPPSRRGFGSRVLEGTVRGQLDGTLVLFWDAAGLVCDMDVPLGRDPLPGGVVGSDANIIPP